MAYALVVDARDANAEAFRARHGFLPLSSASGSRLSLPLASVARDLSQATSGGPHLMSSNDDQQHHYATTVAWTGNTGEGTASLRAYEKIYDIAADGKPVIAGSADPAFRGDPTRWNPEDLLVASLSACHMLWYLSLAARARLVVVRYGDRAEGEMIEERSGSGRFTKVTLRPEIVLAAGSTPEQVDRARALHHEAHAMCFVANSVNFPVAAEGTITVAED